jgi:hypothetical protein
VPLLAPPLLAQALKGAQVTHSDEGRSGFQLTFEVGRSGPIDLIDYRLLSLPQLRPFSRVILIVTFNATPRVLMDGIITNQQLAPGNQPGSSTLTLTGEDVSLMMDMEEKTAEHIGQTEALIALKIIGSYAQYGLTPMVSPTGLSIPPNVLEEIPNQHNTDLKYIQELAGRHGYVFYITPGPVPGQNVAYWGPPIRYGIPQRALSVNMGAHSNVETISFEYNALSPTIVRGTIQDKEKNRAVMIRTLDSDRPSLSVRPALLENYPNVRVTLPEEGEGLTQSVAQNRAQSITNQSTDQVVTANGELNAMRYGELLKPRGLVGLRGVGYSYDGLYYVKSVSHTINRGEYKQSFTLTREGLGSISPGVLP